MDAIAVKLDGLVGIEILVLDQIKHGGEVTVRGYTRDIHILKLYNGKDGLQYFNLYGHRHYLKDFMRI